MKKLIFLFILLAGSLLCSGQLTAYKGLYVGDSISGSYIILIDSITMSATDTAMWSFGHKIGIGATAGGGGGGGGDVTSVGLSLPAQFTVSGSPITTSGTLTAVWANAAQNTVFAGPSEDAGVPIFRALVVSDIPLAGGSGITFDGSDIDLDGALDAPAIIIGTEVNYLEISMSDASDRSAKLVFRPADGLSMRAYTGDDYTGDSSFVIVDSNFVSMGIYDGAAEKSITADTANATGIVIRDDDAGIGLKFHADYSSVATSLSATPKVYQDQHLGGQAVNATIYSPGDDEHGDLISWDTLTDTYVTTNVVSVSQAAGILLVATDTILYDNTTVDTIVTLPVGTVIKDILVYVKTTFNGSGTDLLDVGIVTDAARYENDLDLAVTPPKMLGLANVADYITGTSYVIFQYFDSGTDASTGEAYIYVYYSIH